MIDDIITEAERDDKQQQDIVLLFLCLVVVFQGFLKILQGISQQPAKNACEKFRWQLRLLCAATDRE